MSMITGLDQRVITNMPAIAERLRLAYPAPLGRAGVGSIPANPDALNLLSFSQWRFEMKLSSFKLEIVSTNRISLYQYQFT
jgi:hypothetical protein